MARSIWPAGAIRATLALEPWNDGVLTGRRERGRGSPPRRGSTATDLVVGASEGSDWWRTTHYGFLHDDGHGLLVDWPAASAVETTFDASSLTGLYDQAGLLLWVGPEQWIKTGLEVSDGVLHLGAVVTNGVSDWSLAPVPEWAGELVTIRASRGGVAGDSVTLRARTGTSGWRTLRVAPFTAGAASAGPMVCAPMRADLEVRFTELGAHAAPTPICTRIRRSTDRAVAESRSDATTRRPRHPNAPAQPAGLMLWFCRNTLPGSSSAFTRRSRSRVAGGYIAAITWSPNSIEKLPYMPLVKASAASLATFVAAICSGEASGGSTPLTMRNASASRCAMAVASGATRENAPPSRPEQHHRGHLAGVGGGDRVERLVGEVGHEPVAADEQERWATGRGVLEQVAVADGRERHVGHRGQRQQRREQLAQPLLAALQGDGELRADRHPGCERRQDRERRVELVGSGAHHVAPRAQHSRHVGGVELHVPADEAVARHRLEHEAGHDAEVAAAAAHGPEHVGVLVGVDREHLAGRGDELDLAQAHRS